MDEINSIKNLKKLGRGRKRGKPGCFPTIFQLYPYNLKRHIIYTKKFKLSSVEVKNRDLFVLGSGVEHWTQIDR